MSDLLGEILLRLAKVVVVAVLGVVLYFVAIGPLGEPSSFALGLLCWISAAAFWLLIETSPL